MPPGWYLPGPLVPSENCKHLMSVLRGLWVFPAGRVLPTSIPAPSTWHGEATVPLQPRFLQSQTRASTSACGTPSTWATTPRGGTGGSIRAGSKSGTSDTARASPHLGLHPPHTCAQEAAGAGQTQCRWGVGGETGRSRRHRSRVPRTRMGTGPPLPPAGFPSSRTLVLCQRSRLVGTEMP